MEPAVSEMVLNAVASLAAPTRVEVDTVNIFGIPVANVTMAEAIEHVRGLLDEDSFHHIAVVNTNKFWQARHIEGMNEILQGADFVIPEYGAVWASRVLGSPLKENVRGVGLFLSLIPEFEEWDVPVYFLGAKEEVLEEMLRNLRIQHPFLRIAGARNGFFDASDEASIVSDINASGAAVLFVAMGSPRQEFFIDRYCRKLLPKIAMGVGGSFDVLAGLKKDAPKWTHCGIESLYRLSLDPKNLMGRYLRVHPWFVWRTLRTRILGV